MKSMGVPGKPHDSNDRSGTVEAVDMGATYVNQNEFTHQLAILAGACGSFGLTTLLDATAFPIAALFCTK